MNEHLNQLQQLTANLKDKIINQYHRFRINTRTEPYRILFLLSHMRSGSSLFTHILNSNPEIIGYGETHLNYAAEEDFQNLIFKVYGQLKELKMNHKYVLDKILHIPRFTRQDFLKSEQLFNIFLIREPTRTLASILDIKPHWSQEKILNYYTYRLSSLENYAKFINNKEHCLFLTHEQLLNQTDSVFTTLKDFLKTEAGFSEQYQVLKTTGMRGIGDSSENIQTGRIIRESKNLEHNFSPELLDKGFESFRQCYATLSDYCTSIKGMNRFTEND